MARFAEFEIQPDKKKSGRFYINYYVYVDGKRVRRQKYGKKSDLIQFRKSLDDNKVSSSTTVEQWSNVWKQRREVEVKAKKISDDTLTTNKQHINHINELIVRSKRFGDFEIGTLSTSIVDDVVVALEEKTQTENRFKQRTAEKVFNTFSQICSYAVIKRDLTGLEYNPTHEFTITVNDKADKQAPTPQELQQVLASGFIADYLFYIEFISETGLRAAEFLGLLKSDFEGNVIHVTKSFKKDGNLSDPKTKYSVRDITLSDSLTKKLNYYLLRKSNIDNDWLFQVDYRTTDSLCYYVQKAFVSAGVKKYDVHSLRHYYITEQIELGTPLHDIKRVVGHAPNSNQTQATYFTVRKNQKRDRLAAEKINKLTDRSSNGLGFTDDKISQQQYR